MTEPATAVGREDPRERGSVPARVLAGAVRGYQLIVSPWFAPTCRYYPSCSAYGIGALHRHGALKGSLLTGWRLLRCNPWSHGGVDPVPERGRWTSEPPPRLDLDAEDDDGAAGVPEPRIAGLSGEAVPSEAGPRAGTAPARAHRTRRPE